jgi:hypothetical protein
MDAIVVEVRYQGILVGRAARARELSVTGAFVEMDAPMPVGSPLTIAPDGGPVMGARVVRVAEVGAERGMALCWSGLDEEARRFLARGLGVPPVDLETGVAPSPQARRAEPSPAASGVATEPTELDARATLTDLRPPPGIVTAEVAPDDEISAPLDVSGGSGEERAERETSDGGKGRRGKRRRR